MHACACQAPGIYLARRSLPLTGEWISYLLLVLCLLLLLGLILCLPHLLLVVAHGGMEGSLQRTELRLSLELLVCRLCVFFDSRESARAGGKVRQVPTHHSQMAPLPCALQEATRRTHRCTLERQESTMCRGMQVKNVLTIFSRGRCFEFRLKTVDLFVFMHLGGGKSS
jgi:hypothetical protein